MILKSVLFPVLLFSVLLINAQDILDIRLDGSEQGKPLAAVLSAIEKDHSARFYFLPEWIEPITFLKSYEGHTLEYALNDLFRGTELSYLTMYAHAVIIIKDPTRALLRKNTIETAIREEKKVVQHRLGEPKSSRRGQQVTISGQVTDSKNGEPVPYATIQVSDTPYGTTTDLTGNYTLTLSQGAHVLHVSYVEYDNGIIDLEVYEDGEINIELEKKSVLLDEVVIRGEATQEMANSRIGQTELSMREMKHAPAFLGEVDLVKQVQALPGVTSVGEAASGYNVRGGSVDQNLILYDGIPVFNSSHVFGFFTAFNPEAIRDVTFYKGGIPAEYGGRISSVLDIRSKDGSYEKWSGKAGIGMITGNFTINGPLQKGKTALAASLRTTYSNWLVHSIRTDYADLSKSSVSFYDGTLKLTHLYNDRTKLSFTGYSGRDAFKLMGDSTYQWGNLQISAKLDHQWTGKLGSEFVLGASSYGYKVLNEEPLTASELSYRITSSVAKARFNYQEGNHQVNFGWQLVHYQFDPGQLKPTSSVSNAKPLSIDNQRSIENALYITDSWTINKQWLIEAGIRLPVFVSYGPAMTRRYKNHAPYEPENVKDTIRFKGGETIKAYFGLEPRLSFRWMTGPSASVKLGYNRMYQFLHLVTNTTAVTPVDIWQPSGYYFKPQWADQLSAGYFRDFSNKQYGASTEVFYKKIRNILDFKDGAQLILNRHLETELLQGNGRSYGIETSFSKNHGRLTGSLNYTYSRSFRKINGPTSGESINAGKQYPANFDQPHIVNFSWKYNLSRRYSFTGNFTYHSGRPVTIPLSAFTIEHGTVTYFSARNQYRIPDYHRLDLALIIEGNHKRDKRLEGRWVFSVYNVYGRKNPYTVFFKDSEAGVPKPYQLSIIGTVFPSISYNLDFR